MFKHVFTIEDHAEEQDRSGFLSFSCSNKLKTNEDCMIDLNSKINRIFLSSCINRRTVRGATQECL
jgi:hypothetical protein